MALAVALLYLFAAIVLALIGLGLIPARAGWLAAGAALLAFSLPAIAAGL